MIFLEPVNSLTTTVSQSDNPAFTLIKEYLAAAIRPKNNISQL